MVHRYFDALKEALIKFFPCHCERSKVDRLRATCAVEKPAVLCPEVSQSSLIQPAALRRWTAEAAYACIPNDPRGFANER
jgi:hypothetical protein